MTAAILDIVPHLGLLVFFGCWLIAAIAAGLLLSYVWQRAHASIEARRRLLSAARKPAILPRD